MESLYRAILGVSENASEEEVGKAYQKLMINCYPHGNPEHTELSPQRTRELSNAFDAWRECIAHNAAAEAAGSWGLAFGAHGNLLIRDHHAVDMRLEPGGLGEQQDENSWLAAAAAEAEAAVAEAEAEAANNTSRKQLRARTRSWADSDSDTCVKRRAARRAAEAARRARLRETEDPEVRAARLAMQAAKAAQRRAEETLEQRAKRLSEGAARAARRRAEEDPERRAARLAEDAARASRKRAEEDAAQRAARRAAMAARAAQRRAEETPEQRVKRLAADAARAARKRAEEDPERRMARRAVDAARASRRRAEARTSCKGQLRNEPVPGTDGSAADTDGTAVDTDQDPDDEGSEPYPGLVKETDAALHGIRHEVAAPPLVQVSVKEEEKEEDEEEAEAPWAATRRSGQHGLWTKGTDRWQNRDYWQSARGNLETVNPTNNVQHGALSAGMQNALMIGS